MNEYRVTVRDSYDEIVFWITTSYFVSIDAMDEQKLCIGGETYLEFNNTVELDRTK